MANALLPTKNQIGTPVLVNLCCQRPTKMDEQLEALQAEESMGVWAEMRLTPQSCKKPPDCATAIALGNQRFLHVVNFYAQSGQARGATQTHRERCFRTLFEYCSSLGEQPVLVTMDANVRISASGVLAQVLSSGKWIVI